MQWSIRSSATEEAASEYAATAVSLRGAGFRRHSHHSASRLRVMNPVLSSTLRSLVMAGRGKKGRSNGSRSG